MCSSDAEVLETAVVLFDDEDTTESMCSDDDEALTLLEAATAPRPPALVPAAATVPLVDDGDWDHDDCDDFDEEKMERLRKKRPSKKRLKQEDEPRGTAWAIQRVQQKIRRGERLDCANRIRAEVATEAALTLNDRVPPECPTEDDLGGAHAESAYWNDEPLEGESEAERLQRLEGAGQLHRLGRWEKHALMANLFPE